MLTQWQHDPLLSRERCPDVRFVWNLAIEASYSELHASAGISTIKAILLDVGGRPTTSMTGNGVRLGSAVALCHSLGLNRNPLPWDIPQEEKHLRMKIWWSILLHDRWYVFELQPFKQWDILRTSHPTGQVSLMGHHPISEDRNMTYHCQYPNTCQTGNEITKQTQFSSSS